jgi:hypothetical protein
VTYSDLKISSETGGSDILSYNLQMDDGLGNFTDVHGYETDVLGLSATVKAKAGVTYGFRYRARNLYGWGAFSTTTFILAARRPSTPPKPEFISATDNSISIKLYPSTEYVGAVI